MFKAHNLYLQIDTTDKNTVPFQLIMPTKDDPPGRRRFDNLIIADIGGGTREKPLLEFQLYTKTNFTLEPILTKHTLEKATEKNLLKWFKKFDPKEKEFWLDVLEKIAGRQGHIRDLEYLVDEDRDLLWACIETMIKRSK